MFPVFLNSENRGYDFQEFARRFIEICEKHKADKRALVFGFILYDLENAQIAKVLKDTDYWMSLNAISGKYMTVFSVHYKPLTQIKKKRLRLMDNDNTMHHMVSVANNQNPAEGSNLLIERYFGSIEVKYPAVLFFQIEGDQVLDHTLIELNEEAIEPAFLELKLYIKSAVETLKMITEDNRNNNREIFELVKGTVRSERTIKLTNKVLRKVTSLSELASSLMGLGHKG